MKVLVTGANGLVGQRLVAKLVANGHTVTAMSRGPQRLAGGGFSYVSVDLGDGPAVVDAAAQATPDVILNPAGMTDVDGCERDPNAAFIANVEGVASLCRAAKQVGAHLVHVSTDYVFDGDAGPYDVDALPNPQGVYALTKHMGEQTVRALVPPGQWAVARTAVVYGWPNAGKNNFGSWLVDALGKGQQVKLFADQWVSSSLALNVADMLVELAEKKLGGLWHTCGAEVVDRVTFGRKLCERFGFDPALITPSRMADVKLLSPRPAKSGLIVTKTAQALDHKPLSLAESLEGFHAEFQRSNA